MLARYIKNTSSIVELDISNNHLEKIGDFLVKEALNLNDIRTCDQRIKLTL